MCGVVLNSTQPSVGTYVIPWVFHGQRSVDTIVVNYLRPKFVDQYVRDKPYSSVA